MENDKFHVFRSHIYLFIYLYKCEISIINGCEQVYILVLYYLDHDCVYVCV